MPQTLDLVLEVQFSTLELYNFQVIDRGMDQAIVDFTLERLMLLFEFSKVRLHRHAVCLLNQCPPMDLSLAQTHRKGDVTPGFAPRQTAPKPLISGDFSGRLNAAVENAIIIALTPNLIPA
jgi:hypothetical protein